jgi:uncharacterized membrane protein YphA (DoxX/SURF4 family)
MLSDPNFRTAAIAVLLRLALAAIFLYHGLVKVSPRNEWGLAWATNIQRRAAKPNPEAMALLHRGLERLESERAALKEAADKLPEGSEKAQNAEQQKQAEQRQEELRAAEARIGVAYSEANSIPEALSYPGFQFAVAWGELLGGLALLVGVLTRLASAGLILIMIGAVYTMTQAKLFTEVTGAGFEYNLAIVAMCLVLILTGAGPLSIDHWLAARRKASHHQALAV